MKKIIIITAFAIITTRNMTIGQYTPFLTQESYTQPSSSDLIHEVIPSYPVDYTTAHSCQSRIDTPRKSSLSHELHKLCELCVNEYEYRISHSKCWNNCFDNVYFLNCTKNMYPIDVEKYIGNMLELNNRSTALLPYLVSELVLLEI